MKFGKLVAASLLAMASTPAAVHAQATGTPESGLAVGVTVYGPESNEVGTIVEMGDGYVILDTGNNRATLPADGFGKNEKGPQISMTKAQIDEAIEAAQREADAKAAQEKAAAEARLAAALVAGAEINTADGVVFGTVSEIKDDGSVVIDCAGGPIALPKEQFTTNDAGALALPYTNEQLQAAVSGA